MKLAPGRTSVALLGAVLALATARPAAAQLQHDRGTILNIDARTRQIEIKDAKDRERIWPYASDATVKFSDKAWGNRGATLKDLRVGMYVHFTYSSGSSSDKEVIQDFDVKDAGKQSGGGSGGLNPEPQPLPGMQAGRVTAVDLNVAQVEVMLDRGGRKTFQAQNARVLAGVKAGDRVGLRTEKDANGQDMVVEVQRMQNR
jgi:Cu/Ag efflux protein CusF